MCDGERLFWKIWPDWEAPASTHRLYRSIHVLHQTDHVIVCEITQTAQNVAFFLI